MLRVSSRAFVRGLRRTINPTTTTTTTTNTNTSIRLSLRTFRASPTLRGSGPEVAIDETPPVEIGIVFINRDGEKVPVLGRVGESLWMCAFRNQTIVEMPIYESCFGGGQHPDLYGGGPHCDKCHVYIDKDMLGICGTSISQEHNLLEKNLWLRDNSRLSCMIDLTQEMDGMHVAIPQYDSMFDGPFEPGAH